MQKRGPQNLKPKFKRNLVGKHDYSEGAKTS
jgi:hypothetical protein